MKTIIIPTNCGQECVNQLHRAMNLFADEQVNCIFLQVRQMPDNYNDMLTIGRNKSKFASFDLPFQNAAKQLKDRYGNRVRIVTDYIYGDSPAVFRNYVDKCNADLVIYDKHEWQAIRKQSLNIFRMVSRSGTELMYVGDGVVARGDRAARELNETANVKAPESVLYQYQSLDNLLSNMEQNYQDEKVIEKKFSNLSRYFLNESILEKLLVQSRGSYLLLTR